MGQLLHELVKREALNGAQVVWAQTFSVGTSANVGEIPQCALLPDGRIVLAATDLAAGGPLAQFQTLQYNWEGVGILDPISGGVTAIPIANLPQFPGVINALTVDLTGTTVYIGHYISTTSGDLWAVPVTGGPAVQVATLPAGASNLAIDNDGTVLVTTLNGPPNLFRYDPGRTARGEPPLQIDSAAPKSSVLEYARNEARFRMVEHWEPLDFELPPVSEGAVWRRVLDTWLDSPEDINGLEDAPSLSTDIYHAHTRSMIMLVADWKDNVKS